MKRWEFFAGGGGFGGQQIILDMENNRILIVNSTNQHYNWKKLVLNVIKEGK